MRTVIDEMHMLAILLYCTLDQRNMGMSMRVEQSTLEQVKKRFEIVKKRKDEEIKKYGKVCNTIF